MTQRIFLFTFLVLESKHRRAITGSIYRNFQTDRLLMNSLLSIGRRHASPALADEPAEIARTDWPGSGSKCIGYSLFTSMLIAEMYDFRFATSCQRDFSSSVVEKADEKEDAGLACGQYATALPFDDADE